MSGDRVPCLGNCNVGFHVRGTAAEENCSANRSSYIGKMGDRVLVAPTLSTASANRRMNIADDIEKAFPEMEITSMSVVERKGELKVNVTILDGDREFHVNRVSVPGVSEYIKMDCAQDDRSVEKSWSDGNFQMYDLMITTMDEYRSGD